MCLSGVHGWMQGLEHVPLGRPGRPVLLVGNHQTLASDTPLTVAAFLQVRWVRVRVGVG